MRLSDTGAVSVLIRAVITISFESEAASRTHDLRGFGPVALGCMDLQTVAKFAGNFEFWARLSFWEKFRTNRLGEGFIMSS